MEWWKRTTKKVVDAAKTAVNESVKAEAKNLAATLIPTAIGIGVVIAGLAVFKSSMVKAAVVSTHIPAVSRTSIVTNNYFFDEAVKREVLSKIMNL